MKWIKLEGDFWNFQKTNTKMDKNRLEKFVFGKYIYGNNYTWILVNLDVFS